jgi:hypothetical protein
VWDFAVTKADQSRPTKTDQNDQADQQSDQQTDQSRPKPTKADQSQCVNKAKLSDIFASAKDDAEMMRR